MAGARSSLAFCACAVAVAALAAFATTGAQRCQSACVRVSECGWLAALLRPKPRPPEQVELLQTLICGRDGHLVLVCCGPPPGQPQPQPHPEPQPQPQPENLLQHRNFKLLPMETCGLDEADIVSITRGNVTTINHYPWIAPLAYSSGGGLREFLCGGSLINRRYVLTASHCVNGKKLGSYRLVGVRLGEWDQRTEVDCQDELCAPPPEDYGVEEAIPHPEYLPQNKSVTNDIALLRLDRDVTDSDLIRPVCLPITPDTRQASFVGKKLIVAGWGSSSGDPSPVKLYAGVPVVDEQTCQQKYTRWNRSIVPLQMCAGGTGDRDLCLVDSGGPLMAVEGLPRRDFLVGISSFGPRDCGTVGVPAVYTRVSSFLTWILDNIRP